MRLFGWDARRVPAMLSGKVGVSMSATTSSSSIPTLESLRHRHQVNLLIESLRRHIGDRGDVFVGGNMAMYYSQQQIHQRSFLSPDFFVAVGTQVQRERESWVVWEEGGKMPDVVIELISESTEAMDRGVKMDIYANIMKVLEYYIYDPLKAQLEGYELGATGRYQMMDPAEDGSLPCQLLALRLAVRPGAYQLTEGPWLRWVDLQGGVLAHDGECPDPKTC